MMTIQPQQTRCARCGQELKIVEVRVPIVVEAQDAPASFTRYETREEVADCPRCTGGY